MGKKNNTDFVSDLHERANHNINPHYWVNRVTPFTMAQWRTNKYFAPLFFVMYSAMGALWLGSINQEAMQAHKSFWSFIFDFSDSNTSARFVGLFLFSIYWVIAGLGTSQSIIQRIYAPQSTTTSEHKKEKKKKYPKRPKNYK